MQAGDREVRVCARASNAAVRLPTTRPVALASPTVSVIIPTLNERAALPALHQCLGSLQGVHEILFVDGGSTDGTVAWLRARNYRVIETERGRGSQLAAGAAAAGGEVLWFVHADTEAPVDSIRQIQDAVRDGASIGAFTLRFSGQSRSARWMTWLYARLRHAGLSYGDAGIFARRDHFEAVKGFPDWPLFEDQALLRRFGQAGYAKPVCLQAVLCTSSRRFAGWRFPFVFAQWVALQILVWLGVSPRWLARSYSPARAGHRAPGADRSEPATD